MMVAFLVVLQFDGGKGARAWLIVPQCIPELISHRVEDLQMMYE